jgi:hypothetical protein
MNNESSINQSLEMAIFLSVVALGKAGRCRATICTAKGLVRMAKAMPCDAARQRPHDSAFDDKTVFVVRLAYAARKSICRASHSMSCIPSIAARAIFVVPHKS